LLSCKSNEGVKSRDIADRCCAGSIDNMTATVAKYLQIIPLLVNYW